MTKVAILGAGPCGLVAGYVLSQKGISVDIYEKSAQVGGLSGSMELWGTQVELGPHFLLKNEFPQVGRLLDEIALSEDFYEYERLTRIYWNGKFLEYPPRIPNIIKNLGAVKTLRLGLSFAARKMAAKKQEATLRSYITNRMGAFAFKAFFKDYSEKLWGIDSEEIHEEFAMGLIGFGELNLRSLIKKFLIHKDPHIQTNYAYPKRGLGSLWQKLQDRIQTSGGQFYFGATVAKLILDKRQVTGLTWADGTTKQYDHVISTIGENALIQLIGGETQNLSRQLGSIRYRNLVCIFLKLSPCRLIEDNNLYIYNKKMKCVRITNYNRFRNKPENEILMLEYWDDDHGPICKSDEQELRQIALEDLAALPLGNKIEILDMKIIRLNNAYTVPDLQLKKTTASVSGYLSSLGNLHPTGRANQTRFNYSMSNAMSDGINAAYKIIELSKKSAP